MIFFKILSLTSYFRDEQNSSNFQLPQREAGNTHESRAVIRKEQEVKPLPAGKFFFSLCEINKLFLHDSKSPFFIFQFDF